IGSDPLGDLFFVRKRNCSAVYLPGLPELGVSSCKTILESSHVARRITKYSPNDFRILVGKGTLSSFPNDVRYSAGLVKEDKNPSPLIVETRKGFSCTLRPRYHINTPSAFTSLVLAEDRCRG